jgi:hypothetical protein
VKSNYGNEPLNWAASAGNGGTPGEPNDPGANPTVSGTDGNDVFYVKLDAAGSHVEVYLSNPPGGAPAYSFPINSTESLAIALGWGGDDRLTDFGSGFRRSSGLRLTAGQVMVREHGWLRTSR